MDLKFLEWIKSLIFFIVRTFFVILITIILINTFLTFLIIVVLIFMPLRATVALLARKFRPDLDSIVKDMHVFFTLRTKGVASSNIMAIITLDGSYSLEHLRKIGQERVLNLKKGDQFVYDKLWKTWEVFLSYDFWKIDQDFNITNHVRDYDYQNELALPNPCSEADVEKWAAKLINAPWDPRRSPWEFLRIENLEASSTSEKDGKVEEGKFKTGLILRFDHALGDGYSLTDLGRVYLDTEIKLPALKLSDTSNFPWWKKVGMYLISPYCAASDCLPAITATKLQLLRKLDVNNPTIVFSPAVDVATVKIIKNHFKVHYASVIYSAIVGAVYRACESSGQRMPRNFATCFAVPMPNHPGGLSIHASAQIAAWPLKCNSRVERLQMIQRNFVALSRSTGLLYLYAMGSLASYTPVCIRNFAQKIGSKSRTGVSLGFTLFPVSLNEPQFEGKPICEMKLIASVNVPCGLIAVSGGISNRQGVNFFVQKGLFASQEETEKLGIYFVEELHHLLEETL